MGSVACPALAQKLASTAEIRSRRKRPAGPCPRRRRRRALDTRAGAFFRPSSGQRERARGVEPSEPREDTVGLHWHTGFASVQLPGIPQRPARRAHRRGPGRHRREGCFQHVAGVSPLSQAASRVGCRKIDFATASPRREQLGDGARHDMQEMLLARGSADIRVTGVPPVPSAGSVSAGGRCFGEKTARQRTGAT